MADQVILNFQVTSDMMSEFEKALKNMMSKEVLVGFPEEGPEREDEDGNPSPITNAALGYIHNFGAPDQNIPARPFMVPGIEGSAAKITSQLEAAGIAALDGDSQSVDSAMNAAGMVAKSGIQNKITDGPFAPLSESTLRARAARGRQGAKDELESRAQGNEPNAENARPLVDTGQLRQAVQYVLKE